MGIYGHRFDQYILNSYLTESDNSLSQQQIDTINKILNDKFGNGIDSIIRKELNKFRSLKHYGSIYKTQFFYTNSYNQKDNENEFIAIPFYCTNYTFKNKNQIDEKEQTKVFNTFISDCQNLCKQLKIAFKGNKDITIYISGDEGMSVSAVKSNCLDYYKQFKSFPSNGLYLIIKFNTKTAENLAPSIDELNKQEQEKFTNKFIEFAKFVKNPQKLSGGINSIEVLDIIRILDIPFSKFDEIISKNIKSGTKIKLDPNNFDNYNYGKSVSKELGECYLIDRFGSDEVLYSISKKKLYWINFEHSEFGPFSKIPYNSPLFEDIVWNYYEDQEKIKATRALFKKIDEEKNLKIFDIIISQ